MPAIDLFLDSSALISGILSSQGAARVLLLLSETGHIRITISEQVIIESERALARKAPRAVPDLRKAIMASKAQIVHDPAPEKVASNLHLISHKADVPILLAAMEAGVDYLVTLNRKHFIDDPQVSRLSGLRIGTPGDALDWLRDNITE